MTKKIGAILLAAFLIVFGAVQALSLTFQGLPIVLGGLAIAAGVCILIDK